MAYTSANNYSLRLKTKIKKIHTYSSFQNHRLPEREKNYIKINNRSINKYDTTKYKIILDHNINLGI